MSAGAEWENRSASYRSVLPLAAGGVGEVELAVRKEGRFQRLYAIKRLRSAFREDPEFLGMFVDEARIAGLIRHPNVVSVLDVGEDRDGPYLVMDYVDGVSVTKLISEATALGELLPLQVACRIVLEAAEGLHAAHELTDGAGEPLHLVHRDVSPQNLLVGFDGITRVTDFGIAKALGRSTHTQTGVVKGKFGYMPPEMLLYKGADRRSDLFSLGVVLFELCAGRRLYRSEHENDGPRRILDEPPPDLGEERDDVPPELIRLIFSMLAKDPAQRPASARAVSRALEGIITSLVQLEGRVEVASCVQRLLGGVQEERQREIQRRQRDATVPSIDLKFDEPTPFVPRSRWSMARSITLTVLLAILVGAATGWALWPEVQGPADASASATAPERVAEPKEPSLLDPEEPQPTLTGTTADVEAASDEAEVVTAVVEPPPPPARRERRLARPPVTRRAPEMRALGMLTLWEFDGR